MEIDMGKKNTDEKIKTQLISLACLKKLLKS